MGKKCIIEVEKGERIYRASVDRYGLPTLSFIGSIDNLKPYAALDLEQVRKEAYEDGYKTAKVQCNIQAEKDLREVGERHYQKGLSDGRRIERENILKTLEKVSDDNVDYDKLTLGECRIILGINKRMQKKKEGE